MTTAEDLEQRRTVIYTHVHHVMALASKSSNNRCVSENTVYASIPHFMARYFLECSHKVKYHVTNVVDEAQSLRKLALIVKVRKLWITLQRIL